MPAEQPGGARALNPADAVSSLAQELTGGGMVMKAVLTYDMIDGDGDRELHVVVTDEMSGWDLQGMLTGILDDSGEKYRKRS